MAASGSVVRAMTNDGAFRVIIVDAPEVAKAVVEAQGLDRGASEYLAELCLGTALIRETMAPTQRVQAVVRCESGRIVADSHPDGLVRGLVRRGADGRVHIGNGALQVMRTLPTGAIHSGTVRADLTVRESLMQYMQTSEQVASAVDIGVQPLPGTEHIQVGSDWIDRARGYVVQLLPEVHEDALGAMIARLEKIPRVGQLLPLSRDPADLLPLLLGDSPYTILERTSIHFGCVCSEVRFLSSLATLTRDELAELAAGGETMDVQCDYCMKKYLLSTEQVRGLLSSS